MKKKLLLCIILLILFGTTVLGCAKEADKADPEVSDETESAELKVVEPEDEEEVESEPEKYMSEELYMNNLKELLDLINFDVVLESQKSEDGVAQDFYSMTNVEDNNTYLLSIEHQEGRLLSVYTYADTMVEINFLSNVLIKAGYAEQELVAEVMTALSITDDESAVPEEKQMYTDEYFIFVFDEGEDHLEFGFFSVNLY